MTIRRFGPLEIRTFEIGDGWRAAAYTSSDHAMWQSIASRKGKTELAALRRLRAGMIRMAELAETRALEQNRKARRLYRSADAFTF